MFHEMKLQWETLIKNDYGIIIKNFTNENDTYFKSILQTTKATTHQFEQVFL